MPPRLKTKRAPGEARFFKSDNYKDGRTKQAFKDSTDINKLLFKASQGEAISHLAKHGAMYGDFTDIDDLLTANERLTRGRAIFAELPGEVRREFNQDASAFFKFVNDPANVDRLPEILPGLAQANDQLPEIARTPERMAAIPDPDPSPESGPAPTE